MINVKIKRDVYEFAKQVKGEYAVEESINIKELLNMEDSKVADGNLKFVITKEENIYF